MVEDYGEDDDEAEDELQTRKGKFLQVEAVNGGYRETAANGKTTEYRPSDQELEISIDGLALHATAHASSGTVHHQMTGKTATKFRAIGTEGNYPIFDVTIGSETAAGTAIIRHVYERGGHAVRSKMSIGLPDEAVKALGEKLPGTLRVGGIEKGKFYYSDTHDEALLQDYWSNHVVPQDGPDKVTAEWQFTFDTVTHSPEGYSKGWMAGWMGYNPPPQDHRHVSGNIGIHFSQDHPLKPQFEGLVNSIREIATPSSFPLWVIGAALVYLAYKAS